MKKTFLFLMMLFVSITMTANVITVAVGSDLQAAINGANSGDQVKVQAGTFTGNFTMKEGVQVSGGWNETFTSQTDYATVLDANADGRVLNQPSDFSILTIWRNFTIQNGNLKAIDGNKSLGSGVALFKNGRIVKCLVQNNTYSYSGNCLGGGLGNDSGSASDIMADSCIIRNNKASHGGGVRIRGTIQNSIIEDNLTEANAAGGVHLQGGRVYNCIIRNNTGKDTGGARLYGACEMINCLVYGNTGKGSIGGVSWENGGAAKIINNTIVNNNQEGASNPSRCGFRAAKADANAIFANNVIWGNKAGGSLSAEQCQGTDKTIFTGSNAIVNNAVYNAAIGVNGIKLTAEDPGFIDAANGDFSLLETSLLVNKGDKTKNTTTKDLAGKQRVRGGLIDIGCYEYQSPESRNTYVKVGDNLQDSINLTVAGYTVYVQAGTFYGNFTMKDGVNVSGGWNAEFTSQTDYSTVLDANADGRVLNQPAAFTTLTVWSNFTIQNGKLTAEPTDKGGAGVWLNKNGQVKHCLIQKNTFTHSGTCMGGGIGNEAVNAATDVLVDDCIIRNNCATHGGGVRLRGTIQNSIIENNNTKDVKAGPAGGAHLQGGRMVNCIVRNNVSGGDTGGVRLYNACQLIGSLIANNTATNTVGGVGIENANSDIIGNTIVCNEELKDQETVSKCGLSCGATDAANGRLSNNIIWGNKHRGVVQDEQIYYVSHYNNRDNNAAINQTTDSKNSVRLAKSNTEDEGNNLAPHFVDPENGDFRLAYNSPCLNMGGASYASSFGNTKDLDGNNRPYGGVPDLGCYELQTLVLDETADNTERIVNKTLNVQLIRTLSNASFNSFCLPFALNAEQIEAAFGAGCQVMEMSSAELTTDVHIDLNFTSVTEMQANVPYIIQPAAQVVNPVFTNVTLEKSDNLDVELSAATFHGLLAPKALTADDKNTLFIGADNTLLYPTDNSKIKAMRAYITITADSPAGVPVRMLVGGKAIATTLPVVGDVVPAIKARKAIMNGELVIIKDNKMYNAQGLQL